MQLQRNNNSQKIFYKNNYVAMKLAVHPYRRMFKAYHMDALLQILPLSLLLLAAGVTFVGGVVKGTVGFALPTVMISGLSTFISPEIALAALIFPTLVANGWQAMRQGIGAAWDSLVKFRVFLLSGLLVLMISAQFVRVLPQDVLFLIIGVPVVAFAVMQLSGWQPRLAGQSFGIEAALGSVTGFLGGLSGIWGPPTVAYLTAVNTPKTEQIRVQGAVFGLGAFALVGAHLQSGVLRAETAPLSVLMVIPALAGMFFGLKIQDRIDQVAFRRATLWVLLIAGSNLVRKGVFG